MRDSGHKGRLALPDLPPRMAGVEHLGVHAVVLRVKGPAAAPLIQVAQEPVRLIEAQAAPEVHGHDLRPLVLLPEAAGRVLDAQVVAPGMSQPQLAGLHAVARP